MHIHVANGVITVSVRKIYDRSSPHARRQIARFFKILNQFSNGDWGHPDLNHRNKTLIDTNKVGLLIVGRYGDLVVYEMTCWSQLPETKVRILNPYILTYEEALQKPEIRQVLALTETPVVEFMRG